MLIIEEIGREPRVDHGRHKSIMGGESRGSPLPDAAVMAPETLLGDGILGPGDSRHISKNMVLGSETRAWLTE